MEQRTPRRDQLDAAFASASRRCLSLLLQRLVAQAGPTELAAIWSAASTVPGLLTAAAGQQRSAGPQHKRAGGASARVGHSPRPAKRLRSHPTTGSATTSPRAGQPIALSLSRLSIEAAAVVTGVVFPFLTLSEHVRLACACRSLRSASGCTSTTTSSQATGLAQTCEAA